MKNYLLVPILLFPLLLMAQEEEHPSHHPEGILEIITTGIRVSPMGEGDAFLLAKPT